VAANKLEILIEAKKDVRAIAETTRHLESLRSGLGETSQQARQMQADFGALGQAISASLLKVTALVAAVAGSAYLFKSLAENAISTASGFERMRVALDTLTKGRGREIFEELNAWALKMPVSTEKAIEAFTMMRAMGLKPTIEDMTVLIDTTSALGGRTETLEGIARALGQIYTKGRLSAEELMQLAEHGVPAYEILQEKLGLTADQLKDVADTAIGGREAVRALLEGMAERFGGQASKIQDTWSGLTESLVSYWKEFVRQVMDAGPFEFLRQRLKDVVTFLNEAFQSGRFQAWAQDVAKAILSTFEALVRAIESVSTAAVQVIKTVHVAYEESFIKKTVAAIESLADAVRGLARAAAQVPGKGPDWLDLLLAAMPAGGALVGVRRATTDELKLMEQASASSVSRIGAYYDDLSRKISATLKPMRDFLATAKEATSLQIQGGFAGEVEAAFLKRRQDLQETVRDNIKALEAEISATKEAVDKEQKAYDELYKKWQQVRQNQTKDAEKFSKLLRDLAYQATAEFTRGVAEMRGETAFPELARLAEREYYDRLKAAEEKLAQARREAAEGNYDIARQLAEEVAQAARELPGLMEEAISLEKKAQEAGEIISGRILDFRDKAAAMKDASQLIKQAAEVSAGAWQEQAEEAEEAVRKQRDLLDPLKALWEDLKQRLEEYKKLLASLSQQPTQIEIEVKNLEYIKSQLEELSRPRETVLTIRQQVITEQASRWGGLIGAFARGGLLPGWGGGDRIRALLEAGEYVIRKEAVRRYGIALFDALNNMRVRLPDLGSFIAPNVPKLAYATGGPVVSQPTRTVRLELGIGGKFFNLMSDEVIAEALERHLKRLSLTRRI